MRKFLASLAAAIAVLAGSAAAGAPALAAPAPSPGVQAAKGMPGKVATPPSSSARAALAGPYFFYNVARQSLAPAESAESLAANLIVTNNFLAPGDFHTLQELAVTSHNGQNHVEVGYTKDPAVCGTSGGAAKSCLFVYRWTNGVPSCYNLAACGGFVEYAPTCSVAGNICAGDDIAPHFNTQKRFQIQHSGTVWWVAYDAKWIGYYPDSLWTGATPPVTFTSGGLFQVFGEIAANVPKPCTDMGNGLQGSTDVNASRLGSTTLTSTVPAGIVANFPASVQPAVSPAVWSVTNLTTITSRIGGPGWNAAGTAVGVANGC
jgi:hypothetical protein